MVKIEDKIRKLIVFKMLEGQSQVKVARYLQIGQTTMHYIWQKYMKIDDTADAKKSHQKRHQKDKNVSCPEYHKK